MGGRMSRIGCRWQGWRSIEVIDLDDWVDGGGFFKIGNIGGGEVWVGCKMIYLFWIC